MKIGEASDAEIMSRFHAIRITDWSSAIVFIAVMIEAERRGLIKRVRNQHGGEA
jgi:hypothetical protein